MKRTLFYSFLNTALTYNNWFINNNLRVLAYHTVPSPINFEKQVKYLQANFNIISIYELQAAFYGGEKLPDKPLLITFDDGDVSVYKNAFPVLQSMGLPSVLFIITGLIDSNRMFWCRQVETVFEQRGKSYKEARIEVNRLKRISEFERREYFLEIPEVHSEQLSSQQIKELNEGGMFIGNHTHTHPMINNCNEEQIREELDAARTKFKYMFLIKNFSVFAYPNGNWDPTSEKILLDEGIKMAFLFDHNVNKGFSKINPMRISRIRVNTDDEIAEFKVKVSGLHSEIMNLRRKLKLNII